MRKTSSTNYENEKNLHGLCDAAYTLSLLTGRWKLTILVKITEGKKRFSELKNAIPFITERILALQLKELENSGLIKKEISQGTEHLPLYVLTTLGKSLNPVVQSLSDWGKANK